MTWGLEEDLAGLGIVASVESIWVFGHLGDVLGSLVEASGHLEDVCDV